MERSTEQISPEIELKESLDKLEESKELAQKTDEEKVKRKGIKQLLNRISNYALVGMVALNLIKHYESASDDEFESKQSVENKESRERFEQEIEKMLLERTGVNLAKVCRESGYKATVEVDGGAKVFILDVPQVHWRDTSDDYLIPKIIESQKSIEEFLINLKKEMGTEKLEVYAEAFTDRSFQESLERIDAKVSAIPQNIEAFDRVIQMYKDLTEGVEQDKESTATCSYIYRKKALEIKERLSANASPEELKSIDTKYKEVLEETKNDFDRFGEDGRYVIGYSVIGTVDGIINVQPSETSEANKIASVHIDKLSFIRKAIEEQVAKISSLDESDADKKQSMLVDLKMLIEESTRLTVDYDLNVMQRRNDIAVDYMANSYTSSKIIPIIYGALHDLSRSVKKINESMYQDQKIGLIRVDRIKK